MMREFGNPYTYKYTAELNDKVLAEFNREPETLEAVEKLLDIARGVLNAADPEVPVDEASEVMAFDADMLGNDDEDKNVVRRTARFYSPGSRKLAEVSFGPTEESHPDNYYYVISEPLTAHHLVSQPDENLAPRSVTIDAATGSIVRAWGVVDSRSLSDWQSSLANPLPVSKGLFDTLRTSDPADLYGPYSLLDQKIARDGRNGRDHRTKLPVWAVTHDQLVAENQTAEAAEQVVFELDQRYGMYWKRALIGAAVVASTLTITSQSAEVRNELRDVPGGPGVIAAADFFIDNNTDEKELLIRQRMAMTEIGRSFGDPSAVAKFGFLFDEENLPVTGGGVPPSAQSPEDDMHTYTYDAPAQ